MESPQTPIEFHVSGWNFFLPNWVSAIPLNSIPFNPIELFSIFNSKWIFSSFYTIWFLTMFKWTKFHSIQVDSFWSNRVPFNAMKARSIQLSSIKSKWISFCSVELGKLQSVDPIPQFSSILYKWVSFDVYGCILHLKLLDAIGRQAITHTISFNITIIE